jgi:hypothetical protein
MNIEHVEIAWLRIKAQAKRAWAEVAPRPFKRPEVADSSKLVEVAQEKPDLRS